MSDKVIVWKEVDSCETCPRGQKEMYSRFRCKEDVRVEFVQNRDTGVPADCPFRKNKPPVV
jgi:hypothetical protein